MKIKKKLYKYLKRLFVFACIVFITSRLLIPNPSFEALTSTVALDSTGYLLGAKIASDGQWRFPQIDTVPEKFKMCITQFEDKYFYWHPGVNLVSIIRALKVNLKAGRIEQGGSTLTMQVARMLGKNQQRTIFQKLKELLVAFHLEINFSKDEILAMYTSNAPFGGNVVGLEAASWRYYGRKPNQLSWAETALLAVLPNAPSLLYPGKNHEDLKNKRDRLLRQLQDEGIIDMQTYELSVLESLPLKPLPLPKYAYHLLDRVHDNFEGKSVKTTIDRFHQERLRQIINRHIEKLEWNETHNAAAIVIDVKQNKIVAYVGNATNTFKHGNAVDVVKANRSTGSLLKPLLYASMLTSGELLPKMLVADIPTYISGYSPKNYYLSFDGAVKANEALYRSLNVPFVRLLQQHGVERFYSTLESMKMNSLNYGSGHYGLSLILGGAECKLLEVSSMYASMARVLKKYNTTFDYSKSDYETADFVLAKTTEKRDGKKIVSAASIYYTFDALTQSNRPTSEAGWKTFTSSNKIAWKTGTSFGNKDAWAVGVTPEYVVGIWVGNADGEGRPGLTGVTAAAPIMFEVFDMLPQTTWFQQPYEDMTEALVCRESGRRASVNCEGSDTVFLPKVTKKIANCTNHRLVHLSGDLKYQVTTDCEQPSRIVHQKWFELPPAQEWFYKVKSPTYKTLPPYRSDCLNNTKKVMDFIYPSGSSKVYIPIDLEGNKGAVVFNLAHNNSTTKIFWHLDGEYMGYTQDFHQYEISVNKGWHSLIVVDEAGNELVKRFEVLNQ